MKRIYFFCIGTLITFFANAQCPTFTIDAPNGTAVGCIPGTVPLNAMNTTSLSSVTYTWIGSVSGTTTGVSINATAPNTFSVYASSPASTCIAMQMITLSTNTYVPPYKIVFTPTAITCSNPTVALMPMAMFPSTVPVSYTFTSPAPTSTSNVAGATFSVPGTYTMVYMNQNNGCTAITMTNVPVNITPPPTFSVGPYYIPCGFSIVQLSAGTNSSTPSYTYNWTGPVSAGITCFSGPGCYNTDVNMGGTYSVDITNTTNGCVATNTMSVVQYTNLAINISGNTTICTGETATLNASGATNYTWSSGSTTNSEMVSPTITGTTYTINGMSSTGPCYGQTTVAIIVNACVGIKELEWSKNSSIAPNPNNGKFNILINTTIENAEIKIVNAIGQEVLKQTLKQGSNEINGSGLSKGIYYYIIIQNKEPIGKGKIVIE
jgi:hypothetical protein